MEGLEIYLKANKDDNLLSYCGNLWDVLVSLRPRRRQTGAHPMGGKNIKRASWTSRNSAKDKETKLQSADLYPSRVYYMSQSQHLFTMALLTVMICLVDSPFLSYQKLNLPGRCSARDHNVSLGTREKVLAFPWPI
ncbi:hypothetical protein P5673_016915 [Acropora cervicornis]|uniref:Uncharacterized protein n=1 Tax=Acropora cervicornis TaxID=6130 RepID=A0AAD9QFW9_ACRCE|nr:hypothetical protein P5673_016915 [Acropora cervicornis]